MKPSLNKNYNLNNIGVASYDSLIPRNATEIKKESALFNFEKLLNLSAFHTTKSIRDLLK